MITVDQENITLKIICVKIFAVFNFALMSIRDLIIVMSIFCM